jgi:hypothetical protein
LEAQWVKLFKAAGIEYFRYGFSSPGQAAAQLMIIREKITSFREGFLSKLNKYIRAILNDTDSDTALTRAPTLNLNQLITTGMASSTTAVWTQATDLQVAIRSMEADLPNMANQGRVSESTAVGEALIRLVDDTIIECALMAPDVRVIGSFDRVAEPYLGGWSLAGTTVMATAGATARSILAIEAIGTISRVGHFGETGNHYIVMAFASDDLVYANGLGFPTELIGERVTLKFFIPRTADVASISHTLNGVSASVAVPAIATADTIAVEEAAGTATAGTVTKTVNQTDSQIWWQTFTVTASTRVTAPLTTANAWFAVSVYRENPQGAMWLSSDGVLAPVRKNNARVIDCIGGINIDQTLATLNMCGFARVLNFVHAHATAHGDAALFNIMNKFYVNHVMQGDDVAALNTNVPDPLKSTAFWFGSTGFVGISKTSREALYRQFFPLMCDELALMKVDGTITFYLKH